MYVADDETKLLENIDKDRGYVSRSGWMKEAAKFYLKYKGKPTVKAEIPEQPIISDDGIDSFLDGFK